jgi:hypothetical protein
MQDHEKPERQHPRKKDPSPLKTVLIAAVLMLLVSAGAVIYLFNGTDTEEPFETEQSVSEKQTPPAEKSAGETDAASPPADSELPASSLTADEVQGEEPAVAGQVTASAGDITAGECRRIAEQIHGFFTHIDSEDYIKQFELQEPSQAYFIALADKLLKNPPVVSRESDDLYTILKNMAHFFRVIGKDNIILIKTILDRERDKIEDVAADFYQWTAGETCKNDLLQFSPPLEEMYEYAGFFLNTMGGRSYLFRRDSRSRLLVNYYSVLLIERANTEGINRHGIDITQIIPQLVQEIDSSSQLIYKENYIDSLYELLEKYQ